MNYRDMTPEQKKAHIARVRKWQVENSERFMKYQRKYQKNCYAEHPEIFRKRISEDVNKNGITKHSIRQKSQRILFKTHDKIQGYEIHHCFGYEDQNKFIYIPRDLHLKIHKLLRDNKIPADSDHWNSIRDLVNTYEGYTYIRI